METEVELQQEQDFPGNEPQIIRNQAATDPEQVNDSSDVKASKDADVCGRLSSLYETLKEPIPENPSASYISEAAHRLVDGLNEKRKNDTELIERFKQTLEAQTMKCIQTLEQQLYQTYEVHNSQVDKKLQDLFACLDNISATEIELENFRESLSKLYQEMKNFE